MAAPCWNTINHQATSDAQLFVLSDEPLVQFSQTITASRQWINWDYFSGGADCGSAKPSYSQAKHSNISCSLRLDQISHATSRSSPPT